jgi:chaperonin cofactor prefoldin
VSADESKQLKTQTIINFLQLVVLIVTVAAVFMSLGRRDEQLNSATRNLNELEKIVLDLVKSQVAGVTKDSEHDRVLSDLKVRINRLELK